MCDTNFLPDVDVPEFETVSEYPEDGRKWPPSLTDWIALTTEQAEQAWMEECSIQDEITRWERS